MQDIYVDDIGKGFPLVLVHGYLGSSEMWTLQKEYLSIFQNYNTSTPGFGESFKAKSLNSIKKMAQFIIQCLDEKKINSFNLMGHSMGGMIVQEMAITSPEKINKLICFATGSIGNIPDRFETMETSIERLKSEGIKTVERIPPKWFVEGENSKYFFM